MTALECARHVLDQWNHLDCIRLPQQDEGKPITVAFAEALVQVRAKLDEIAAGKFCRLCDHGQGFCDCREIVSFVREALDTELR